jgi:Mpv17 / PMP22 family
MFSRRLMSSSSRIMYYPHKLWQNYSNALERHPLATKSVTSCGIAFFGDVLSQNLLSTQDFDYHRLLKYSVVGGFLVGPVLHYWYGFVGVRIPGNTLRVTLMRLAIDQLVFSPCFTACFVASLTIMNREPVMQKLNQDLFHIVQAGWVVWTPMMFINFKFVPSKYQVLFSNSIGLIWNIYLSKASNKKVFDHKLGA